MSARHHMPAERQTRVLPNAGNGLRSGLTRGLLSLMSPAGATGRLSILMFHKIPVLSDPLVRDEMNLGRFERILDFLVDHANVLPLSEAVVAMRQGALPARTVALTFDDGYAEWIDNVSPALRKRKLPATFFVTTDTLGGEPLWHERITSAVRALPDSGVILPYGFGNYGDLRSADTRSLLVSALQERFKYAPLPERLAAIEQLEAQACRPLALPKRFDAGSVRDLHSQGFEIGAHTVHHPILNECTAAQARNEIGGSREQLEAIIGGRIESFAYPNGRPGEDYSAAHVAMVKACGYTNAVTTSGGAASASSDMFQLPRFSPWGDSEERIAFQLARNMLTKARTMAPEAGEDDTGAVRCLLVASTFPPIHGGSAVVYDNLCRHLPAGSIQVLTAKRNYVTGKEITGWREHDASAPYPVERIDLLRPLMAPPPANVLVSIGRLLFQDAPLYARALLAAGRLVRKHKINVVCIGELVAGGMLGIALKKLFNCKLVFYVHGEEITTVGSGRLYGNRRRQYLQAADKVVAVSSFTCDALTGMMGVRPETISLIPNGVDTERFTPGARDPELIARHQLAGKKVVLTVGRLVRRKGIDMALHAMAQVMARRSDVHYLIVGDGELREELERTIAELQLGEHVTLVGKVTDDELLRYLRTCDLFLMPNRTLADGDTEGFGLVFREANACHKPVVGGRAGGAVEAVHDGKTGLLVDGYKPEEIAAAVERILADGELAERLSTNGLQLARENSTAAVARQFLKTCARLVGRPLG
jgi:phosphatidylinositol alpha-1,6-mannosyltransferase